MHHDTFLVTKEAEVFNTFSPGFYVNYLRMMAKEWEEKKGIGGYSTDPSSENSSSDRIPAASRPEYNEGYNGYL